MDNGISRDYENPEMLDEHQTTEWTEIVISYGTWLNQVLTGPFEGRIDNSANDLRQNLDKAGYYNDSSTMD